MALLTGQGARRDGTLRRRVLAAAASAFASTLLLITSQAQAAACEDTKRTIDVSFGQEFIAVNTVVRSEAKYGVYNVVIKQDNVRIEAGRVSANGAVQEIHELVKKVDLSTFKVIITPAAGESVETTCSYEVDSELKAAKFMSNIKWVLLPNADTPCSGPLKISCNKSYHPGQRRWNTTFVITD